MTDYGLSEATEQLIKAFQKFGEELTKTLAPILEGFIKLVNQYGVVSLENADPKLKHLALYSKKARVRKKNLNRIIKELTKG